MRNRIYKIITDKPYLVYIIWFSLSFFTVGKSVILNYIPNNYLVYKYNFINLINQHNLYLPQPSHYTDLNHYGPIFALIIAPFALLPDSLGMVLWVMFNAFILMRAIQLLPFTDNAKLITLLICAHELMTSSANVQVNPLIVALILFSFYFIKKEKDFWAALMITLGLFIKLYGIVGLAFFFFSDNKVKLIGSLIFWSIILIVLPMLLSSPKFIFQTYNDWYVDLISKNQSNIQSTREDISVMGMIRKIAFPELKNLFVIIPGILLFGLSYIRINYLENLNYQLLIVASTLIFPVIFSTGSESPTYIIAFVGVAIWFINSEKPTDTLTWFLLILALILTSFSPSDLFPRYLKIHFVEPYALKALPCFLIWLKIIFDTLFRKFNSFVPTLSTT